MTHPLKDGLKNGSILVACYGETIHLYSNTPDAIASVEKQIKKALHQDGVSLNHRDGSREFVTHDPIVDLSPETPESDRYTWDKSGDRVKHNTVKHIVLKDGTHSEEIIGTTFRKF